MAAYIPALAFEITSALFRLILNVLFVIPSELMN